MERAREPDSAAPELAARLRAFARREREAADLLPWLERLRPEERERLRADLAVVLAEPEETGEPLDWREIGEILREWAHAAGWEAADGEASGAAPLPLLIRGEALAGDGTFTVEFSAQNEEQLARAAAAVQRVTRQCLAEFLPFTPTAGFLLPRGRLKRMKDRDLWQLHLPDGYRLRYTVDKPARVVRVVYFGPHP
jgi:hypothetical protein